MSGDLTIIGALGMWKSPRQLAESCLVILVASFASEGLDKPEQEDALRQHPGARHGQLPGGISIKRGSNATPVGGARALRRVSPF